MIHKTLENAVTDAMTKGPTVLALQGLAFQRPIDVVMAPALSVDDKRAILAAWASDYYAIDSQPALRQIPGTPEPVLIDEVQRALAELDCRYQT